MAQSEQSSQATATQPKATINEITVTAERRRSTAQKVALSISVRTGAALQQQGKYSLQQILEDIPGVTGGEAIGTTGAGTDTPGSGITIRGLGSNAGGGGDDTSVPPSTAVYTDGIYSGIGNKYDIERVEVLRGPQGTLYGRSATGGVVSTWTRNPDLTRAGGYALAEYGDFGLRHLEGALNIPLIKDELALRVAAIHYERQGYTNPKGTANQSNGARAKLLYKPNADLSVLLGFAAEYDHTRSGGTTFTQTSPNGPVTVTQTPVGIGQNSTRQFWGQVDRDLGFASLTDIIAFRDWHQLGTSELDQGTNAATGQPILGTNPQETPTDDTLTEELRLASPTDQALSWQTGVFYFGNFTKDESAVLWDSGSLAFIDQVKKVTRNPGVFGEATYKITPTLRLTGGLRYDYAYVHRNQFYELNSNPAAALLPASTEILSSYNIYGPEGGRTFSNVTFRVRLEDELTPVNTLYALVSSAASPGDVFATAGAATNGQASIQVVNLQSETVTSYELGSKNRFWDNRIQANGDVYYATYGGYQQAGVNISGNPLQPEFITLTSAMHLAGVEAELLVQPTAYDRFGLNVAYESSDFVNRPSEFEEYIARKQLAGVAPFTLSASYDHNMSLAGGGLLTLHLDTTVTGPHDLGALTQYDLANYAAFQHQGTVALGNANINFTPNWHGLSANVWVRNFANTRYRTSVAIDDPTPVSSFTANPVYADGRTFGVQLRDDF